MKRHSMFTRKDKQKEIEEEDQPEKMEEIEEIIGELVEEDVQENQPGNPTQPELEVEVIFDNPLEKPVQDDEREQWAGDLSLIHI